MHALGITDLQTTVTDFNSLIPGLNAGRFDACPAGVGITKARCEQVIYSNPDWLVEGAFVVKKGNPKNLHSYAEIAARSDATIGVTAGSVDVGYAKAAGIPGSRVIQVPGRADAIAAVLAGRIDVYATTNAIAYPLKVDPNPDIELLPGNTYPPGASGKPYVLPIGVIFRPQDTDLRDAYNKELLKLNTSGQLLAILKKYDLAESAVPPPTLTAAAVCS